MGKYMRKGKGVGKMAVIEGALGVCTRARALALQKDSKQVVENKSTSSENTPQQDSMDYSTSFGLQGPSAPIESNYMELRSRRLEKVSSPRVVPASVGQEISGKHFPVPSASDDCSFQVSILPNAGFDESAGVMKETSFRHVSLQSSSVDAGAVVPKRVTPTASTSNSISMTARQPLGILTRHRKQELASVASQADMEVDVELTIAKRPSPSHMDINAEFFGESPMIAGPSNKDRHRRRTRENTPDSYAWSIEAPGSTSRTRRPRRNQVRSLSAPPFNRGSEVPSSSEIEAFFQGAEQQERRRFIERYNFDPANERPLRGRYEWTSM